jgi:type I restriction enzyme S subunit
VTPDQFFAKFALFADTPNAVAKMRELILNLAVRGHLVAQHPDDELASALFERMQKEKNRLISARVIKRQDTDPINKEEYPFPIPISWIWSRLGAVGDWGSGSTPARGNHELYGGGIAWFKSGELNDSQMLTVSEETLTELALKTGSFRRNQPGDVLLAMYGATIGKVAILAAPAVTNQAVCGCTPFDVIINKYLFIYLLSQRANFHAASEGGAQPNISKVKIVGFPIPIPPLAEQKRIVAKVDELMALCDQLESQQKQRETKKATLVQAALTRFTDAPTPANLEFLFHKSYAIDPAELRKTILTLAVRGSLLSTQDNGNSVDLSKSGPMSIPSHWRWSRLDELASLITKGSSPKWQGVSYVSSKDGVLFITSENVGNYTMRKLDDLKYVDKKFNDIEPRSILKRGDLLINIVGASIGRSALYELEDEANINQAVSLIRLNPVREHSDINKQYLLHYLNSPFAISCMLSSRVSTAQPNISLTDVRGFQIPLPPLAEQKRIVAKVEELMGLVDKLEAQLAASRDAGEKLMEAVVAAIAAAA